MLTPSALPSVAVIGSGISGLAAAYRMAEFAKVTLFEAGPYFGGHTHTVDIHLEGQTHGVDTGFLVFNERTYPQLIALFAELDVATAPSDMSFSVQAPASNLEWSGSDLNSVFAQRRNLVSPSFLRMLWDIGRFNQQATRLALQLEAGEFGAADAATQRALDQPIADFLDQHRLGTAFREGYLLPMIGCIWSCPTDQMLQFPVATLVRFCHNHGLLQVRDRPQWFTVRGGARHYVDKILQRLPDARLNCPVQAVRRVQDRPGEPGVLVHSARGEERFDDVVLACHSDQSLALLSDASPTERSLLGAIRYHPNRAVLHTDTALLPRRRLAWAAWNYERALDRGREEAGVCLHYWLNRLQPLPWQQPVVVSLNPARAPRADSVLGEFDYAHPVFDRAAIAAQQRLGEIQGRSHVWFCGAWMRYGFHEDGLRAGLAVAQQWHAQAAPTAWRSAA
jgi:predicted NAD/FAD-binding protein